MQGAVISLTSVDTSGLPNPMVPAPSPERCQVIMPGNGQPGGKPFYGGDPFRISFHDGARIGKWCARWGLMRQPHRPASATGFTHNRRQPFFCRKWERRPISNKRSLIAHKARETNDSERAMDKQLPMQCME